MPRPQFTLRALLVAMLVVAAFFGGSQFGAKREQQRLADERSKHRRQVRRLRADERALETIVTDERLRGWHQAYLVRSEMRAAEDAAQDAEDGITEPDRIERALYDFGSRWGDELAGSSVDREKLARRQNSSVISSSRRVG